MKLYCTEILAVEPATGNLLKWIGPNVPGINLDTAREYCQQNGLGYCRILGELVMEIPLKEDGSADVDKAIDYEKERLN